MLSVKHWWHSLFHFKEYDTLMDSLRRVEQAARETAEAVKKEQACKKSPPTSPH